MASPAVRILVRERFAVPQAAALRERLFHVRICVEYPFAAEELDGFEEMAARTDGGVDVESVLHARQKVVCAVPWRRVDGAGPLIEGDVLGQHSDRIALVQRMTETDALELGALHASDWETERPADVRTHTFRQSLRDNDRPAVDLVGRVVELRMKGDGEVRRNRPRSGRPDQSRDVAPRQ